MIVRLLIVFILHVSLQEEVKEGVIGGSVVLPCSGNKDQHTIQDITVHWRHNESLVVYGIIKGVESVEDQEPEYKSRTVTFSKEYLKGDFSLQLNNLRATDAGMYTCFITQEGVDREVELLIKGGHSQNNSADPSTEKPKDKSNKGAQTGPEKIVTISLLAISILFY